MGKILEASRLGVGPPLSLAKISVNSLSVRFLGCSHSDIEVIGVGRHSKIIHLAPLVEGVIVTLSALQTGAEEYANFGFRHRSAAFTAVVKWDVLCAVCAVQQLFLSPVFVVRIATRLSFGINASNAGVRAVVSVAASLRANFSANLAAVRH